jgi:hypothetical protein
MTLCNLKTREMKEVHVCNERCPKCLKYCVLEIHPEYKKYRPESLDFECFLCGYTWNKGAIDERICSRETQE